MAAILSGNKKYLCSAESSIEDSVFAFDMEERLHRYTLPKHFVRRLSRPPQACANNAGLTDRYGSTVSL